MRPTISSSPALRSLLWRLGRRLYRYARLEGANDARQNGEYRLLDAVVARAPTERLVLLDVGAHLGHWTEAALDCLTRHGRAGEIHAFEPTPSTLRALEQRFADEPRLRLERLALSDRLGSAPFYVVGDLVGLNSLVDMRIGTPAPVELTRLDDYLERRGIERVTFLKSDTEGNDLAVLRGGGQALAAGRVDAWQFEYNARWVYARAFLRDVFELLADKPYRLGKLHRHGVELFDEWHPELERFFETNFVLLRKGSPFEALGQRVCFDRSNVVVPAGRQPRT